MILNPSLKETSKNTIKKKSEHKILHRKSQVQIYSKFQKAITKFMKCLTEKWEGLFDID